MDPIKRTVSVCGGLVCGQGELGVGRMQYRVYSVGARHELTFQVREDEMETIRIASSDGNVDVDLPTGRITADAGISALAEYLTLAFAVGVMFVNMRKHSVTLAPVTI